MDALHPNIPPGSRCADSASQLQQATGCMGTLHLMFSGVGVHGHTQQQNPLVLACTTAPYGTRLHPCPTSMFPPVSGCMAPASSCLHNAQLHKDFCMCVYPLGVRERVFLLPVGAGMCVHVQVSGHTQTHLSCLGCRHLHARMSDVCKVRHTHTPWVARVHRELSGHRCAHISGVGCKHTCSLGVGDRRARAGMDLHAFSLPAISNLSMGSSPCARLKASLQAAV